MEEENLYIYIKVIYIYIYIYRERERERDYEIRLFKESRSETIFSFISTILQSFIRVFLLISTVHGILAGPKNLHSYRGINVNLYKLAGTKPVKN